jgi:hypothetical protein
MKRKPRGNTMSHGLARIVILATVACCMTGLLGPTARGEVRLQDYLPYYSGLYWSGSASCTVTTTSTTNHYTNQETHKWEIVQPQFGVTSTGAYTYYPEKWTVTGGGSDDSNSWTTNGVGSGVLGFRVSTASGATPAQLHIERTSSQTEDYQGITNTLKADGSVSLKTVDEWNAFPVIVADPNSNPVQDNPPSSMVTKSSSGRYLAPSDSNSTVTCWWNFSITPVLLNRLPGELVKPDRLVKPKP